MESEMRIGVIVILCSLCCEAQSQVGSFALPQQLRGPSLPKVDESLAAYLDVGKEERELLDIVFGGRQGAGLIPPATFQVPDNRVSPVNQQLNHLGLPAQLPAGFNPQQLLNNNFNANQFLTSLQGGAPPAPVSKGGSSIAGIPNINVNLPKAPSSFQASQQSFATSLFGSNRPQSVNQPQSGSLPTTSIVDRPEVPSGGLGPLSASIDTQPQSNPSQSFGTAFSPEALGIDTSRPEKPFYTPTGGIFDNLLGVFGLMPEHVDAGPTDGLLGNIQGVLGVTTDGNDNGLIQKIMYNTLTEGALQTEANNGNISKAEAAATVVGLRNRTNEAVSENIMLIQQLLTQSNSPLCNPKPTPVNEFDVDSFMGRWYQVLYSPPMSIGPCSMISYVKQASVANGGPGTVFSTFEYTNEGTPTGPPHITSGYAIVRAPGQLIYRTTASDRDVNVNVVALGPRNQERLYSWAVISVNCNYPLYVFARDTIEYKQKYEAQVNAILSQRKLTTGFSTLLNIVSPVDTTLCSFPTNLFNVQG